MLEFLYVNILVFALPYCIWSAISCFRRLRRNQAVLQDQKQLYICHILNIMIFTFTWIPYVLLHFLSFVLQLDLSNHPFIRTFVLSLVALTPLLNTATRIFCDPSLRQKLAFWNHNRDGSVMDSFVDQAHQKGDLKG